MSCQVKNPQKRPQGASVDLQWALKSLDLNYLIPAAAFSAAALSVFSQVNWGSSRPKCP